MESGWVGLVKMWILRKSLNIVRRECSYFSLKTKDLA